MSDLGLPPAEVQYQESHEYQNFTRNLGGFYIVIVFLTFFSVVLRVLSRRITRQQFQADDWTFLVGAIIAEGSFVVLLIYAFDAGLGEHWVELTPDQRILFAKLNYAYNILNVTNYPLIKISILLLYRRIFGGHRFRQVVYGCVCFVAAAGIANMLVAIFACRPVQAFYDYSVPGTCINDVQWYWATAILNMMHDLIILVLPMPLVWRLPTTFKRKLGISTLFITGGLTFILSILRIVYYLQFDADDPSYTFLPTAFATPAEVCLAAIVASATIWLPVWRVLRKYARERIDSLRSRAHGAGGIAAPNTHYPASTTGEGEKNAPEHIEAKKKKPPHKIRTSGITPLDLNKTGSTTTNTTNTTNTTTTNTTTSGQGSEPTLVEEMDLSAPLPRLNEEGESRNANANTSRNSGRASTGGWRGLFGGIRVEQVFEVWSERRSRVESRE